jgi:hypothetical protein
MAANIAAISAPVATQMRHVRQQMRVLTALPLMQEHGQALNNRSTGAAGVPGGADFRPKTAKVSPEARQTTALDFMMRRNAICDACAVQNNVALHHETRYMRSNSGEDIPGCQGSGPSRSSGSGP